MKYRTVKENNRAEVIEKKSKFIGQIFYVSNKEQADSIIEEIKKKYYDARHNCYSYNIYDETKNKVISKSSDDGEPAGTAGAPIMSVINGNNLINVLIVVTRYFGGILLGTGGLVRAYKQASEKVIEQSKLYKYEQGYEIEVLIDYKSWDKFNYYCKNNKINIINIEYLEKIKCVFEIPIVYFDELSSYYDTKDIVRQKPIISEF